MVSTYFLVKYLKNAHAGKENRKGNKQQDTHAEKRPTPTPRTFTAASKVINETCRVCLQQGSIPIFDKKNRDDLPLPQYIKLICDIDINANDAYPKHLCKTCWSTLDAAVNLRRIANETQIKLLEMSSGEIEYNDSASIQSPHQEVEDTNSELTDTLNYEIQKYSKVREIISHNETNQIEINPGDPIPPPQQYDKIITKNSLHKKYYKQVKKENKIAFQCLICKKVYSKGSLADHLITHLPDSVFQYVCEVCGKTFKKHCSFHQHKTIHSDVLPSACKLCPYKGRHAEQLKMHIKRVHDRKYNYKCPLCPMKFIYSNPLKRHLLRHSEPKFHCTICKKSFYDHSVLKSHNAINHSGDATLHKCDMCDNSYKRRRYLLSHQIKVHKRKKLGCNNRALYLKVDNGSVEHHKN